MLPWALAAISKGRTQQEGCWLLLLAVDGLTKDDQSSKLRPDRFCSLWDSSRDSATMDRHCGQCFYSDAKQNLVCFHYSKLFKHDREESRRSRDTSSKWAAVRLWQSMVKGSMNDILFVRFAPQQIDTARFETWTMWNFEYLIIEPYWVAQVTFDTLPCFSKRTNSAVTWRHGHWDSVVDGDSSHFFKWLALKRQTSLVLECVGLQQLARYECLEQPLKAWPCAGPAKVSPHGGRFMHFSKVQNGSEW